MVATERSAGDREDQRHGIHDNNNRRDTGTVVVSVGRAYVPMIACSKFFEGQMRTREGPFEVRELRDSYNFPAYLWISGVPVTNLAQYGCPGVQQSIRAINLRGTLLRKQSRDAQASSWQVSKYQQRLSRQSVGHCGLPERGRLCLEPVDPVDINIHPQQ